MREHIQKSRAERVEGSRKTGYFLEIWGETEQEGRRGRLSFKALKHW